MTTVHVEAAVVGRRREGASRSTLELALPTGETALRDLIEATVRAEVGAFAERAGAEAIVRILTEGALEDGLASGSVRSGDRDIAAHVDPDRAVRTALDAQRDGLVQTIVDDEPVDDLDAVVEVRDGTRVMFLRLVPLSGG